MLFRFHLLSGAGASLLMFATAATAGVANTSFTYQGNLTNSGQPVDGVSCDFQFGLWDAETGGAQVGTSPISRSASVTDGLFAVDLDFGSAFNTLQERWLQIAVQCPGDTGFTTLAPRTQVQGAPQAQYAMVAQQANSVAWSNVQGVPGDIADGDDVNDADASPTNEIQDLSLSGNTLSLTDDASTVDLSGYLDNTDNQNLFATVVGDSGSTTADTATDTVNIVGSGSISTSVSGDTVTISSSAGAAGQIVGGGSGFAVSDDGTAYYVPIGSSHRGATYSESAVPLPATGTLQNFIGMVPTALTDVSHNWSFTVIKNGTVTGLSCSISGTSALSCSDNSDCIDFFAGQELAVRVQGSNNGNNRILRWVGLFTPGASCP